LEFNVRLILSGEWYPERGLWFFTAETSDLSSTLPSAPEQYHGGRLLQIRRSL
jgi:hypothetical protein